MVATRNHPKEFPDPETAAAMAQSTSDSSPRKRATRTATANHASPTAVAKQELSPPTTPTRTRSSKAPSASRDAAWSHTPSNLTLIWLAISLPLVVWDTGYVVLRPYSMPGGALHYPLWAPYGLYGNIDRMYGFKHYDLGTGWTLAQGTVNALETVAYFTYLYLLYTYGEHEDRQGTGAPDKSVMGRFRTLSEARTVTGKVAAWAVVLGYSTATVTLWKTILYYLNEAFSGMYLRGNGAYFD